jgi:microcin C transport system substrate-binding protein
LDQAGWVIKDQTLISKEDGTPFVFEILLHDQPTERVALHFMNSLKKLGIKVNIRSIDTTSYQQRFENKEYDMILSVIPQSETPGNEQRSFWGSKTADLPGGYNFPGIKDPVVDQLIELVINSASYEELQTRVRALDRVLLWGYYMVPGWHMGGTFIAYWDRFGKPAIEPKFASMPFTTWWIDKDRIAKLPDHLKRGNTVPVENKMTENKTSESFFQRLYNHIINLFKKTK